MIFARLGLFGRLMLIVMGALSTLVLATIGLDRWQHVHQPVSATSHFPRVDQAADIFILLRQADPSERPAILNAVSGGWLRAEILDAPPSRPDWKEDPRLEARLRRRTDTPDAEVKAYTATEIPHNNVWPDFGRPQAGFVERMAAATARLPDGRFATITFSEAQHTSLPWLFGLPLSAWVAMLGVLVAVLALVGASHEMAPLRHVTEALARFDGRSPEHITPVHGAPDIRRLAEAAQNMQERISSLVAERLLLIGAISHDLKTYLTRLRLRAEDIAEENRRDRLVADLDAMTELLETSLSFARGSALGTRRVRVDLLDLLAVEVAEHEALGTRIDLSGFEASDVVVEGDPGALRRVLANLMQNAVKFRRSQISVAVARSGTTYRVVIEDDGPGIPAHERAAVFTPYHRLEQSRSRDSGGTGLGLAIARQIVEAHGGTIEASDAGLGGARLVMTLPAA